MTITIQTEYLQEIKSRLPIECDRIEAEGFRLSLFFTDPAQYEAQVNGSQCLTDLAVKASMLGFQFIRIVTPTNQEFVTSVRSWLINERRAQLRRRKH